MKQPAAKVGALGRGVFTGQVGAGRIRWLPLGRDVSGGALWLLFGAHAHSTHATHTCARTHARRPQVSVMEFCVLFIGEGKAAGVPLASLHLRWEPFA